MKIDDSKKRESERDGSKKSKESEDEKRCLSIFLR